MKLELIIMVKFYHQEKNPCPTNSIIFIGSVFDNTFEYSSI